MHMEKKNSSSEGWGEDKKTNASPQPFADKTKLAKAGLLFFSPKFIKEMKYSTDITKAQKILITRENNLQVSMFFHCVEMEFSPSKKA